LEYYFFVVFGVRTPDLTYIMHCPYQLAKLTRTVGWNTITQPTTELSSRELLVGILSHNLNNSLVLV